jgi:hypothetical protein
MAERQGRWNKGWHGSAWASSRAIWLPQCPEEKKVDEAVWAVATSERGRWFRVVGVEIRNLVQDVFPRGDTVEARPGGTECADPPSPGVQTGSD